MRLLDEILRRVTKKLTLPGRGNPGPTTRFSLLCRALNDSALSSGGGGRIGFLLVHGLAGTPAEMKILGKRLNRYGFTVLCPQLAGHCASGRGAHHHLLVGLVAGVEDAFDALSQHMDAVFVGGLSAGAVLAAPRPALSGAGAGLALYSTTLRYDGWTIPKLSFLLPLILKTPYFGKRYRFEEAFPYGIMDDKLRGRILAQMQSGDAAAAGFTATPGASLKQLWGLVAAVKRDLPSIKTPTLIVHAGNDDIASARSNAPVCARPHRRAHGTAPARQKLPYGHHRSGAQRGGRRHGAFRLESAFRRGARTPRRRGPRACPRRAGELCANAGRRRRAISRFLGCGRDGKSGGGAGR